MTKMMRNDNGQIKIVETGFSWTTLFFGVFVPLFRGDIKWAFIMGLTGFLSCGLSWLIFPFIYNKIYIDELMNKGYRFF